jgi:hypothetical protein
MKVKKPKAAPPAKKAAKATPQHQQKENEAQIAVHWKEEVTFKPPKSFVA